MPNPITHSRKTITLFLSAVVLCAQVASVTRGEDAASGAEVSLRGLRLVARPYRDEQNMRPFNWFAGTALALQVDVASGGLIELDPRASSLERMTDDKGTDLLEREKEGAVGSSGIGALPTFSEDGRAAMVEVSAPRTPHPAAREIRAKGTLVFRQATVKTTFKDVVTLTERATANAGPIPLTVIRVGESKWGTGQLEVTFRATRDTSSIADIRFLDVKGSPVPSRKTGTTRMGIGAQVTVDLSFALTKKVEVVMVVVDFWENMRLLKVPFDVKASVGLAGPR